MKGKLKCVVALILCMSLMFGTSLSTLADTETTGQATTQTEETASVEDAKETKEADGQEESQEQQQTEQDETLPNKQKIQSKVKQYPEYINSQQVGQEYGHPHQSVIGTDFRIENGKYICIWTADHEPPAYGPRNQHYVKILDQTKDIYAISAIRCDLYGGETPGETYYPVYYMNAETDKSYLKDPMFESVKENQKPTKVSDIEETNNLTNGYWTLGTYDGKIETESDLAKVTDTNRKVKPEEQKIVTQTIFIWHEEEQKISDFTFQKMDDKTKQPMQGVEFQLFASKEDGELGELIIEVKSDESGKVIFKNLKAGTYYIKETAPNGYMGSANLQWKLVIDETGTGKLYNVNGTEIKAFGDNEYPIIENYSVQQHLRTQKTASLVDWKKRIYKIDLYAWHDVQVDIPANIVLTVDISGSMPWMLETPSGGKVTIQDIRDGNDYNLQTGGNGWDDYKYYYFDSGEKEYKPIGFNSKDNNWHIIKSKSNGEKTWDTTAIKKGTEVYIRGKDDRTKLNAMLDSIDAFVNKLKASSPNSNIAIVPFAGEVYYADTSLQNISSYDLSDFKRKLVLHGDTNQGAGISAATKLLKNSNNTNPNYIVLFTDGAQTKGEAEDAAGAAKQAGISIFAAGLYNEKNAATQEEVLKKWASKDPEDGSSYAYTATTPEGLEAAFSEIFAEINLSIKNTVIKDIVDTNRFDIVTDSSGEILATNGAYGHNGKLNGSTITWDGVSIGYSDSEENAWHQTIYIKAKNSYIGGNGVTTNLQGSGVTASGVSVSFPQPKVNVLIRYTLQDAEDTVFAGEVLEKYFDSKKDQLITPKYDDKSFDMTSDVNITVSYYYDAECTQPVEANGKADGSEDALRAQYPAEDTTYYVEVQVTPTGTAVSGMESNPDDCLTAINTAKNGAVCTTAKYEIKVVTGSIQITKELEENAKKDATFTFEITKTDDNTKWYRAIYIRAGAKSGKAEILSGLPKGQYNIRELSTIRYKNTKVEQDQNTSCPIQIEGTNTNVYIGCESAKYPSMTDLSAKHVGLTFTNQYNENGKLVDSDAFLNRAVKDENGWHFEQVPISKEVLKDKNRA